MKVLLDECIPRPLGNELTGHDVTTVQKQGWASTKNGKLLSLVDAADFDAFITVDRSLPQQQNLGGRSFGVIVLRAKTNRLTDLEPLAPAIRDALDTLAPGQVVHVEPPAP